MASLSKDAAGNRTVQFVGADRKRRSVRLGKMSAKDAASFKLKIEHLAASAAAMLPLDAATATWLRDIGADWADKLAAVGLMPKRSSRLLGEFLEAYIEARKSESKPATIITICRVADDLGTVLGKGTDLRRIGPEDAERFKAFYVGNGLAGATIHRRLKMARMLFDRARKLKLISENPFAEVGHKNSNPDERSHYISREDTRKLIDKANPTWRVIVALARYAGLRCPSEVLSLKWEGVNFAESRMVVFSPKTEHLEGKKSRLVPIVPDLMPILEDAYELAEPGEIYVVGGKQGEGYRKASQGPNGWGNSNLRTTFSKLILRDGLDEWPRQFHNLRASCETDLMANHPIHIVTAWIGNTPKIALGHYLQTLEGDFQKAIGAGSKSAAQSGAFALQNAVRTGANGIGPEMTNAPGSLEIQASRSVLFNRVQYCTDEQLAKVGLEPTRGLVGRF